MSHRVETLASKAMGAIKATKAKVEGLTGVFAQLSREHGEVTALMLRVKASFHAEVRADLFPEVRAELLSHEKGELLEVYPVFREHAELVRFADEHDRDAQELLRQLGPLEETDFADEAWPQLFSRFFDLVSQHVHDEERRFFPMANRVLGRESSERMLAQYLRTKNAAMQNLL
jgi:hemerythrin-like domain-containing protein